MKYLSFLLIPLLLLSCQREVDEQLPEEDIISTSLKEMVALDTTLPLGQDTMVKILFDHDQQSRIQTISVSNKITEVGELYEFRYHGNEEYPYLIISTLTDVTDIVMDSTFFTYENGVVKRDTAVSYEEVPVIQQDFRLQQRTMTTLIRTGNTVRVQKNRYDHAPTGEITYTTSEEDYTILSEGPYFYEHVSNDEYYRIKLSTILNPYKGIPRYSVFQENWLLGNAGAYDYMPESMDMQGNFYRQRMSYTFQTKPDGYPAIMWEKDLDSGNVIKWIFKY